MVIRKTDTVQQLSAAEQNSLFRRKSELLKLIVSFGVIYTHALNYDIYSLSPSSDLLGRITYYLQTWELTASGVIIPIFYFISGFSFFSGYSYEKTLDKFKRRVFTLFIPWLCWNTIMWLFFITVMKIPALSVYINTDLGYELTLRSWFFDALLDSADGPMWFMLNLMAAVLLSPLIYTLIKNKWLGLVSIAAGMFAVYLTDASRYSILVSTVFFAEAGYCAIHLRHIFLRRFSRAQRLYALGLLVLYMFFCASPKLQSGGLAHVLCFSATSPAIWVLTGESGLNSFWKKFDSYRFWIYCSHYFPLECVEKVWLILAGMSSVAALADFVLAPVVTMALLIAVGYGVKKLCPPVWGILNGSIPKRG